MQSVCVPKRSPCDTSKLCVNTLSADRLHGVRKPMVLLGPSASRYVSDNHVVRAAADDGSAVVDQTVDSLVTTVKTTGEVVKQGVDIAGKGVEQAQQAFSAVSPYVSKGVNAVGPVVQDLVERAKPIASSVANEAGKFVSSAAPQTGKALTDIGVSPQVMSSIEKGASVTVRASKSLLEMVYQFVTTTQPTVLAEYAAGAVVAYLLLPPLAAAGFGLLRGYAGSVSPAAVLDSMATDSNVVLVDIRTLREKESSGIPDVRKKNEYIELEVAQISDPRVRRVLKNVGDLEVIMTAIQIANLKKINKGTKIYIMDKAESTSKSVAKQLAAKGFNNVYVMKGGFSNWMRERLPTKLSTSVSRVEIVNPGSVLFGSTKQSVSSPQVREIAPTPQRRALPSKSSSSAGGSS